MYNVKKYSLEMLLVSCGDIFVTWWKHLLLHAGTLKHVSERAHCDLKMGTLCQ